jgi:hypothetical protein
MTALHRQVKTALDETRLLILGAQILFGFHLNAAFQPAFIRLSPASLYLYAFAFTAMTVAVGLLIAPSMEHRLVDRGRSTTRVLTQTTWLASLALFPLAISLGADLAIVLGYRFGVGVGASAGAVAAGLALLLWYGMGWAMREHPRKETAMNEEHTSIDVRVEHMLTEARVLLPGAQALFGFQMAVLLTDAFGDLPASSKDVHAVALCCIALAIILLMAPAALHRITFHGQNSERFHRIGSRFVVVSAVPLAIGITADLYVALTRALDSPALGLAIAGSAGAVLLALWFLQPLILRAALRGQS